MGCAGELGVAGTGEAEAGAGAPKVTRASSVHNKAVAQGTARLGKRHPLLPELTR
jgi:hypothetical protein